MLVSFVVWTSNCMKCNKSILGNLRVWVSVFGGIHGTTLTGKDLEIGKVYLSWVVGDLVRRGCPKSRELRLCI